MATRRGRTQAYATGNKVYGAGRPMPTIGPVDKSGYRERDAKQMIWKNALSRRVGGRPQPVSDAPNSFKQPIIPRTSTGRPGGMESISRAEEARRNGTFDPNKMYTQDMVNVPRTVGGTQPGMGGAPGSDFAGPGLRIPSVRPLTSMPSGAIAAQANQGMNGLPYDPSYEGVRRAIAAKRDAANAGLNQQRTQMDIEANTQKREIDQEAPEVLRELLERFAGRGLAYSGRYASDVGEQQNQFAAAKSRIDQMLAGNRSALDAEMAKFEAGLQSELSEADYEYARSLAERAGNLGITTPEQPPVAGGFEPLPAEQTQEPVPLPQIVNQPPPSIPQPPPPPPAPAARVIPGTNIPITPNSGNGSELANRRPSQQYVSPAPKPAAPAAPIDLASRPGGVRTMESFRSPADRQRLANGGTVTGGNGYVYKYDPNTSRVVRVR